MGMIAQGNNYSRPQTRTEYQIFTADYFTGSDVNLFFGDIWVDEVINLSFTLTEEVLPIYGYHSYTFDAVSRGRRIVQGSFAINFKTTGYLKTILENAMAVEYAVQKAKSTGQLPDENLKLDDVLSLYGKDAFEKIAQDYEEALWGVKEDTTSRLSVPYRPYFPADQYGFDIKVNYGPVTDGNTRSSDSYNEWRSQQIKRPQAANVTVETVNGVQINGMAKQMGIGMQGQPITEAYTFIARDINAPFYRA